MKPATAEKICRISLLFLVLFSCTQQKAIDNWVSQKDQSAEPKPCEPEEETPLRKNNCLTCHQGLEMIRCSDSEMYQAIVDVAIDSGTDNPCVVCHGGDAGVRAPENLAINSEPYLLVKGRAHSGAPDYFQTNPGPKDFYPDPGSPWINENTCGVCHQWEVRVQWQSLMMTEAGKIQGTVWGFGGLSGYDHKWANYDVQTLAGDQVVGTDTYRSYMEDLAAMEPGVFVEKMAQLPAAPHGGTDVTEDPSLSAFTYIRGECQRCHLAVGGKKRYGDFRGLGCSACHIPYSNRGLYEGDDPTLRNREPGRPLIHTIQSGRRTPVKAGTNTWTGMPVETCTTCHNRGPRIGVSYQGLMETPYASPWKADGEPQQELHGKHYLKLQEDLHAAKGFLCQDCHTTLDVHSSGKLVGAITAAVEIECADCHGTPSAYPWELPLGYMDEYREVPAEGPARGVVIRLPGYMAKGDSPPPLDGYLLSTRGNPLGNVVRQGNKLQVYLASGAVQELKPLKLLNEENSLSLEARVTMVQVGKHMERMECYACHATWAPQCYGCHIELDYTEAKANYDWVEVGHQHGEDGLTPEYTTAGETLRINGEIVESRSYLRWENPSLGQNGEGRVSPVIPGCQTTVTVLNDSGEAALANHIFRIPNVEGAGEEGQRAIDHSPLYPHTVQKEARDCESCHNDPKALGYGIGGGKYYADPSVTRVVDLQTGDGKIIPRNKRPQMQAIPNLTGDWSRFITEQGEQLQTVGHHLTLSRPLNEAERSNMDRKRVCLSCHQEIPDESVAVNLLHPVGEKAGMLPRTSAQHTSLINKAILLSAWVQVLAGLALPAFAVAAVLLWRRQRRVNRRSVRD